MFQTVTVSYLSKKNFKGSWHVCFCMNDKIFLCAILNPASLRQMQMNVFFVCGKNLHYRPFNFDGCTSGTEYID